MTDFRVLFESAPGAFLALLPDDPTFTIVAASNAYLSQVGVAGEQLIGRAVLEAFPGNPDDSASNGPRNLQESFRRILATRQPDRMLLQRYDVERSPEHGGGFEVRYWSILNTPITDRNGDVLYILQQVEEVTGKAQIDERQQRVLHELEAMEKRVHQLAESSTFGLMLGNHEGGVSYMNPRLRELLGYSEEEVAANLVRWDKLTPPEFAGADVDATGQLKETGKCVPYEKVYIAKNGQRVPVMIAASVLEPIGGTSEIAAFVLDLSERKRSEQDAFLVRLDDAIRPLGEPEAITNTAMRMLCEHLGADRCGYSNVDADEMTLHLPWDYVVPGVISMAGTYQIADFGKKAVHQIRNDLPFTSEDVENDPEAVDVLPAFRMARIAAHISVPLRKLGMLKAVLFVHWRVPRRIRPDEIQVVWNVASRCWESIERALVTRQYQASERRLRLALKAGRIGSFEWDVRDGRIYWSPELESLYGMPEGTFEGKFEHWTCRVVPEDLARLEEEIRNCFAAKASDYTYEFRAVLPDDSIRWLRGQANILYGADGRPESMFGVNIDIDERKRADAVLERQWQVFDAALSNIPDHTYIFDLNGRFTYANRALLQLWQKTLDEVEGKTFVELGYPHQLAAELSQYIQQVISTGQPVRDRTPFAGATGEVRYYDYIFTPVIAADGRVEAVTGSSRDITEQKRAEEFIEADRRRWRDLLLQTPAGIAILRGPEHRFEWVNNDYLRLVGRPLDTIVGRTVLEAIPEVEGQIYVELLNNVYRTGEPFTGHESLLQLDLGDGTRGDVYMNFVYLATRDVAGEIDGIFVHVTDVTDMVLARKQIEERERQFRTLAETIPHLAWMADDTGHIFWYNQRWFEFTGKNLEQMEGWGWQSVHDPDVLPHVITEWTKSIASGDAFEMIFPLKGANGRFRTFLTRVEPVKDSRGKVVRWFGTNTDITEQQRTEEELRRKNRELEEFSYVASHDLQEPLRMVNIYTQLIMKRVSGSEGAMQDDGSLQQFAGFVRQGVTRMEALIHDLLHFSRTVHSEEPDWGHADLQQSVVEAMAILQARIDDTGAEIQVDSLPAVRGDTQQMSHVFENLLSNAMKYRQAGVRPVIHISAAAVDNEWVVSVEDNGIGFEPQYAERIFGLFKRLHKEEYPGTGLGLAICRRTVERYGGRIWADGRPGRRGHVPFRDAARGEVLTRVIR